MATEVYRTNSSQTEAAAPAQPKSPDQNEESPRPAEQRTWLGSVRKGKLWCDCEPACRANCLTSGQARTKGRKFWICPKSRDDPARCPFYVWDDEAEEAKAWLIVYGPPDPELLETPVKPGSPTERETPWTKSKRKPVSREASDQDQNGGPSERKADDGYVFVDDEDGRESPSMRGPKRKRVETTGGPGGEKAFVDRLKEAALPTPETMGKGKGKAVDGRPNQATDRSPTKVAPVSSQESEPPQELFSDGSSLTTKVIQLLREEKLDLKESTVLQIRHEIGLVTDMNAAKTKRYEGTISRLSKRLDELETMLEHLTGGDEGSMSEPIYLSD